MDGPNMTTTCPHSRLFRGTAALGGWFLALTAGVRLAAACGPIPERWKAIQPPLPQAGASDVPRDAPLVFGLGYFASSEPARPKAAALDSADLGLKVHVTEAATGREVPGTVRAFGFGDAPFAWVPDAPLAPGVAHRYSAHFENALKRPVDGQGEIDATGAFTTGAVLLPPLASDGRLEVTLASVEVPAAATCSGGGPGGPGQRAQIRLPAVTGGFAEAGYEVRTYASIGTPADVANPGGDGFLVGDWRDVAAGARAELTLLFSLPDAAAAVAPGANDVCFISEARDAAGQRIVSQPLCLAPRAPASAGDAQGGAGCGVGRPGPPPAGAGVVGLAAALACVFALRGRARRRRPR